MVKRSMQPLAKKARILWQSTGRPLSGASVLSATVLCMREPLPAARMMALAEELEAGTGGLRVMISES